MRHPRTSWFASLLTSAAIVAGLAISLGAQTRWSDAYKKGLDFLKKQDWNQAIVELTKAIQADPKSQEFKRIEGTFYEDYFPFYYRGVAYMNAGNFAKAEEDFQVALKTKMQASMTDDLKRRESQVQASLAAAAGAKPASTSAAAAAPSLVAAPPAKADAAKPEPPKPESKPPAPDPHVSAAALVKDGNGFLAQGKLTQALTNFQEAQRAWAQVPGAQEGITSVNTRRSQFQTLTKGAAADRQNGQSADALTKYEQAKAADPEQYGAGQFDAQVQAAQREVVAQRLAKSTTALNAGRDLARGHQYRAAEGKYQEAVDADGANTAAAEALRKSQTYTTQVEDGRSMFGQGNLLGARVQMRDAQSLDPDRFKSDGLDSVLGEIERRLATPARPSGPATSTSPGTTAISPAASAHPPLHDALVAYLAGRMPQAIDLLTALAGNDRGYDAPGRASIHAYLGAAYATNALESRADADRATWRRKAVQEFQAADSAQPGFQLSARIVSPAIRAIVDEARKR